MTHLKLYEFSGYLLVRNIAYSAILIILLFQTLQKNFFNQKSLLPSGAVNRELRQWKMKYMLWLALVNYHSF